MNTYHFEITFKDKGIIRDEIRAKSFVEAMDLLLHINVDKVYAQDQIYKIVLINHET